MYRTLGGLTAVTATALLLTACGSADDGAAEQPVDETVTADQERTGDGADLTVETLAVFAAADSGGPAVTYDPAAVPVGAGAIVAVTTGADATDVRVVFDGLEPDREFGAHAHVDRCGTEPDSSGPHYQHDRDPQAGPDAPSTDPDYANPDNELWLDFTTDADGAAEVEATVDWVFRPDGAQSLVLHERHTATAAGEAGTAGDRLACADVQW